MLNLVGKELLFGTEQCGLANEVEDVAIAPDLTLVMSEVVLVCELVHASCVGRGVIGGKPTNLVSKVVSSDDSTHVFGNPESTVASTLLW